MSAQFVEKASQSFAAAAAKECETVFSGGVYVGENTTIKGSIENNIYGGFFRLPVFGAGNGMVYGHVTTNIYGGCFGYIFGGRASGNEGTVYDGVELNIYGMQEYYPINSSYSITAGNRKGARVPAPQTEGRDAIRLTVEPLEGTELKLNTPLATGSAYGTVSTAVRGGKFRLDPTDMLDKAGPYCVESISEGTLMYQVVRGFRNTGAFIDFGSSLDFTLYLQADSGYVGQGSVCTVVQNKEGVAATLPAHSVGVEAGTGTLAGKMLVTAHGIAAKEMRDELTFTVAKDGEICFSDTLSIYDAVKTWYDGDGSEAYKNMLADLLNYGRAAQDTFGYNEENMGNELPTTSTTPNCGEPDPAHGVTGGNEGRVAVTLSLKEQVELNIYVNDAVAAVSNVTFIPEGKTAGTALVKDVDYVVAPVQGTKLTRIKFDRINVVDAKGAVSFTVSLADGTSFDVTYSIKDYVIQAMKDAENDQHDLLMALQNYVDSVCAYLAGGTDIDWATPGEDETDLIIGDAVTDV